VGLDRVAISIDKLVCTSAVAGAPTPCSGAPYAPCVGPLAFHAGRASFCLYHLLFYFRTNYIREVGEIRVFHPSHLLGWGESTPSK
jgi:hypothetical protein